MIGLYIVTLGIYGFVWMARRRNEIVKNDKIVIPHWLWIVLPPIVGLLAIIPITFLVYGTIQKLDGLIPIVLMFTVLIAVTIFAVNIWWMWRFGRAVMRVTQGRLTPIWIVAYWIMAGPVALFIIQYHFNRIQKKQSVASKPKYRPSKKFVTVSSIVLALLAVFSVASLYTQEWDITKDPDIMKMQNDAKFIDKKANKANHLLDEYNRCIEDLNNKYPGAELTPEEEPGYNRDYANCELIREKQNQAAEEFDKALQKW